MSVDRAFGMVEGFTGSGEGLHLTFRRLRLAGTLVAISQSRSPRDIEKATVTGVTVEVVEVVGFDGKRRAAKTTKTVESIEAEPSPRQSAV